MQQQLQQAMQLFQRGYQSQAEQLCHNILNDYPRQPDALLLMGLIEEGRGSLEQARQLFQKGLKSAPKNLHLLNNLGSMENLLNEPLKAEACFTKALKIDPGFFQARHNLASLFEDQHKYAQAKRLYREVIRQQPTFVDALANLSSILEKEHQLDEAKSFAGSALAINPEHFIARLTLANIAAREKRFDEVITRLQPLVQAQKLSAVNLAVAGGKCAYAHEMMGHYEDAFSFYQNSNQVLHKAFLTQMQDTDSPYAPEALRHIDKAIQDFDFSHRTQESKSPVFLVGFPRSGTTLLDQILSSHSEVTVIEEKENLIDTHARFPATQKGLSELNKANDAELKKLRRKYWSRIERELGTQKAGSVIVDKLPLNAASLLHIYRLFPNAKIIVALRDPRDCVFSGYQQRFGLNPAMFQMLKLDTAVTYYGQVMNIVLKMRDAGVLPMHFVRYEQVVENFTDEVRALTDFLGLDWQDSLLDYQTTAKLRHISTPSSSQVIQPLYKSSIGKWRHYQQWIGASFEPLNEWVEQWGYQAS